MICIRSSRMMAMKILTAVEPFIQRNAMKIITATIRMSRKSMNVKFRNLSIGKYYRSAKIAKMLDN